MSFHDVAQRLFCQYDLAGKSILASFLVGQRHRLARENQEQRKNDDCFHRRSPRALLVLVLVVVVLEFGPSLGLASHFQRTIDFVSRPLVSASLPFSFLAGKSLDSIAVRGRLILKLLPMRHAFEDEHEDEREHQLSQLSVVSLPRSSAIVFAGSVAWKIEVPATKIFAPASRAICAVVRLIPPSTSI
jgi:hypothetical protein